MSSHANCAAEELKATAESRTAGEGGISLMDILIVLAKRRKLIAWVTLAVGCAGALVALLIPNRYTATTVLLPPQRDSASATLMSQLSGMGAMASMAGNALGIKDPNDLYVALLKLEPVEQAMVKKFGLQAEYHARNLTDARKGFQKHCAIANGVKDGLIRISVTDKDPRRAAAMANAYVSVFQKFSQDKAITEAAQRREFFAAQLIQAKDNLDQAETSLKQAEQSKGLVQLGGQSMALIRSTASLRAQIAAKEVEIRAMRSYAGDKNAALLMAEQQLAGWQAQLARLTKNQSGGNNMLLSGNQMPGVELLYARRVRDVKYYETIFDLLAKQFEMAKLDEAREGSRMQIMARAVVPDKKSGPPRLLIIVACFLGGFFLASIYAVFAEGFRGVRSNPEQWAQMREFAEQFRARPSA